MYKTIFLYTTCKEQTCTKWVVWTAKDFKAYFETNLIKAVVADFFLEKKKDIFGYVVLNGCHTFKTLIFNHLYVDLKYKFGENFVKIGSVKLRAPRIGYFVTKNQNRFLTTTIL